MLRVDVNRGKVMRGPSVSPRQMRRVSDVSKEASDLPSPPAESAFSLSTSPDREGVSTAPLSPTPSGGG